MRAATRSMCKRCCLPTSRHKKTLTSGGYGVHCNYQTNDFYWNLPLAAFWFAKPVWHRVMERLQELPPNNIDDAINWLLAPQNSPNESKNVVKFVVCFLENEVEMLRLCEPFYVN